VAADLQLLASDLAPVAYLGAAIAAAHFLLRATIALVAVCATNRDRREAAIEVLRLLLPRRRRSVPNDTDQDHSPPPNT
jgi:hypothetical protein